MWVSMDQSRFYWIVYNQPMLRACLYSVLEDTVACADSNLALHDVGQHVDLSSSYIGGPRNTNLMQ
jgi:hypothetical protein